MVSDAIKKIREDNNLTQEELARVLFVSRQAVSKWERDVAYPDINILMQIAKLYNVSIDSMLEVNQKEKSATYVTIAKSNQKFAILFSILFAIAVIFLILSIILGFVNKFETNYIIDICIFGFLSIVFCVGLFCNIRPLKELIQFNDYGLRLFISKNKVVELNFNEICSVTFKNYRNIFFIANYSHGKISIRTVKDEVYTIRNIAKVQYAYNMLQQLLYKYKGELK